jgi:hypothetical protein
VQERCRTRADGMEIFLAEVDHLTGKWGPWWARGSGPWPCCGVRSDRKMGALVGARQRTLAVLWGQVWA